MTAHTRAQRDLRASEEQLRLFLENVTDDALLQVDLQAHISSGNPGAERTFGYSEPEILGRPMRVLYLPEDAQQGHAERDLASAREHGRFEDARWLRRRDGSLLFARWVTTPMLDEAGQLRGYAKVLRDRLQDPPMSALLADTENRVRAIAALHETLYSSDDLGSIEFGAYAERLVRDLVSFFAVNPERLTVSIDASGLVLDIGQAIPLGLIVNELVTNTFKHAFPGQQQGRVEIDLRHIPARESLADDPLAEDGFGEIQVKDNGVGLPANFLCLAR